MAMTIAVTRNTPEPLQRLFGLVHARDCPRRVCCATHEEIGARARVERDDGVGRAAAADGGVVLFWKSRTAPSGLGIRLIGWPKKEMVDHEGLWLTVRGLTAAHDIDELQALAAHDEPSPDPDDPTLEYLHPDGTVPDP